MHCFLKKHLSQVPKSHGYFFFALQYLATLSTFRANRAFQISADWNRNTKELIYKYSV